MTKSPDRNPRHKRATDNPDHVRRTQTPCYADAEIEDRLEELVKPIVYREMDYYRSLGLRNRLLNLPVMVSIVLTMIWRRVPGVSELLRLLHHERLLWSQPTQVRQPSLAERFLVFPAELFERILMQVLAELPSRLAGRTRPLPLSIREVATRFTGIYAMDGTTLEALFRKLKSLQEQPTAPLAGHLGVITDLVSHLPVRICFAGDPQINDKALLPNLLAWLPQQSLVVFDLGYFSFHWFDQLTEQSCWFVTRFREKTSYDVSQVLRHEPQVRDQIVHLGRYRSNPSEHLMRLVEVYVNQQWRRYLTNVLDPQQLSIIEIVQVYDRRWHIETAFLTIKRLLGLSYLWVGSINGVQLQVWATFLFYAILVDLADDIADMLQLPLDAISVEMVYRSLYYYVGARFGGYPGSAVEFLSQEAVDLGIIKRKRTRDKPTVIEQLQATLLSTSGYDGSLLNTATCEP
jgi:hypothetical protein